MSLKFTKKFQRNMDMRKVNKTIKFDAHMSNINLNFILK